MHVAGDDDDINVAGDDDMHVAGDAAIMTHNQLVIMCRWQGMERQRLDHHTHVAGDREANGM